MNEKLGAHHVVEIVPTAKRAARLLPAIRDEQSGWSRALTGGPSNSAARRRSTHIRGRQAANNQNARVQCVPRNFRDADCVHPGRNRCEKDLPLTRHKMILFEGAFHMFRSLSFLFAAFTAVPVLALAQAPNTAAPASANPISRSQAKMYSLLSNVVIAGAEKMPERIIRLSRVRT